MTAAGDALADEILQVWSDVVDLVEGLQATVDATLALVPDFLGWVVDQVQQLWGQLVRSWQIIVEEIGYCLTHLGSPGSLNDGAMSWLTTVAGPVSARAAEADAGALLVDNTWTGSAGDQYRDSLFRQRQALTLLPTVLVQGISDALGAMRGALRQFFGTAIAALAAVAGGLVGAATASGTVVGLPAGVVAALASLVAFLAAVEVGIVLLKSDTQGLVNDLIGLISENTGFPDGAWPTGTV